MGSPRTTLALAVTVVLVAAWIFFFERHLPATGEQPRHAARLLGFTAAQVEKLRIRRDHWTAALLEREDATRFRVTEPVPGAADPARIARILSALEFLRSQALLEGDGRRAERLHELGLDPPRLELDVLLPEARELQVRFGRDAPAGGGMYLHVVGQEAVHVVDRTIVQLLDEELTRLTEGAAGTEGGAAADGP